MNLTFYPGERFAVFIDSANFHRSTRNLELRVDNVRLLDLFRKNVGGSIFLRIYHYESVPPDDGTTERAEMVQRIRRRLDSMEYNGFTVVSKTSKEFFGVDGESSLKGNMDGEIIVDMMALSEHLNHIVLFSGDGDFCYAVANMQNNGKRVTVISSEKAIANDLKRQADTYVDIEELRSSIESHHESTSAGSAQ